MTVFAPCCRMKQELSRPKGASSFLLHAQEKQNQREGHPFSAPCGHPLFCAYPPPTAPQGPRKSERASCAPKACAQSAEKGWLLFYSGHSVLRPSGRLRRSNTFPTRLWFVFSGYTEKMNSRPKGVKALVFAKEKSVPETAMSGNMRARTIAPKSAPAKAKTRRVN